MRHGLGLGPVPFGKGVPSYTPPERRARRRRDAPERREGTGSPARPSFSNASGTSEFVALLGMRRGRLRGALGASLASHVIGIVLIFLVIRAVPPTETAVEPDRINYDIVWIPDAGPGGGGGGGGNESLEMPPQVESIGEDAVSVPVEVPEEIEPPPELAPETEPPPLEAREVRLSALSMASSRQTRTGLLQGLMARSLDSQGGGTGGGAGDGDGGGIGPGQGDGLGPGRGGGSGGGAYQVGNGVSSPQLIRRVLPEYTPEATRARIEGEVVLDAVVLPDGTVANITVSKSLDRIFGLDEEAIKAAQQFRFRPGLRQGEPVAVFVRLEIFFNLL